MRGGGLTTKRARSLRRRLTGPEVLLWNRLRKRLDGEPVFRRQHPMGPYVLDFFCPAARLAVEIDGQAHSYARQAAHDARRDAWLEAQGLTIYRTAASAVLGDPDQAADSVRLYAAALLAGRPHSRPVYGEGGPRPVEGVVGGASSAPAPSTALRAVPLPRFAGEE